MYKSYINESGSIFDTTGTVPLTFSSSWKVTLIQTTTVDYRLNRNQHFLIAFLMTQKFIKSRKSNAQILIFLLKFSVYLKHS